MGRKASFLLGGVLATLLLQLAAGFFGLAGILFNLFVPLPAAYGHMREGKLVGAGVVVLAFAGLVPLAGVAGAAGYLIQFGVGSFVLPLLLRQGWSWDRAVAGTLAVVTLLAGLALGGLVAYRGQPLNTQVQQYVHQELDQALKLYRQDHVPAKQMQALRQTAGETADFLVKAYPGLAVALSGAVLLLLVALLSRMAAERYRIPGLPFHLWKAPEPLIWVLILVGFGMFFTQGGLRTAALNGLIVLLPVYFLQGLAIVSFYFRKKGISPLFRVLGFFLITALSPIPLIVTGIGVFDLWADFRKPRIKKT
jgi:uncharacterized protein YybS (DUF2232 family)